MYIYIYNNNNNNNNTNTIDNDNDNNNTENNTLRAPYLRHSSLLLKTVLLVSHMGPVMCDTL